MDLLHDKNPLAPRTAKTVAALLVCSAFVLTACSGNRSPDAAATTSTSETPVASPTAVASAAGFVWSGTVDPTAIPLGDGKVSTEPKTGDLLSCQQQFGGRGQSHGGPWIDTKDGTWNSTTKAVVEGRKSWPQAFYRESVQGDTRVITFDDVPTKQVTGNFPIAASDPAHQYDPNPNSVVPKQETLRVPVDPKPSTSPGCVPMGPVGVLENGVFLYNAIDATGDDAAAHETQDVCDGHPDGTDSYHYHDIPSCLLDAAKGSTTLVGTALDGYGIYVERDAHGALPTDADLDACHGRTSPVLWNGRIQNVYHYDASLEFPYTVGCFRAPAAAQPPHTG